MENRLVVARGGAWGIGETGELFLFCFLFQIEFFFLRKKQMSLLFYIYHHRTSTELMAHSQAL